MNLNLISTRRIDFVLLILVAKDRSDGNGKVLKVIKIATDISATIEARIQANAVKSAAGKDA